MNRDMTKGMHWLGFPGSLLPFVDLGEESVDDNVQVATFEPLGGGQRIFPSRRRPTRSWSLNIPNAHPDEMKHVRGLMTATLGPYSLVTSKAQVSNVLTPERSMMASPLTGTLSLAGSWPIAPESGGGWSTITGVNAAAVGGAQGLVRIGPAPIPPLWTGRKVTVSCLLATQRAAGCYIILDWLNAAGGQVGAGVNGNTVVGMDALRRSTVTGVSPWGAVSCRIGVAYAEVLSEPQVTWTDGPVEWSPGNGADRVMFTASSYRTVMAAPDSRSLRRDDYSLGLTETL